MDKKKIGTVIEPTETDWPGATNMFDSPLGHRYARRFDEVYNATLENQEVLMKKLYDDAMADEELDEKQKRIIKACYVGFNEAICKNGVSTPLIAFVSSKKPSLSKSIQANRKKKGKVVKSSRLKRTVEDLYGVTERIGFDFEVALLPELIQTIERRFLKNEQEDDNQLTSESLILASISLFARACQPTSYANLWYASCFMKRIQMLAYINSETLTTNPEFKIQLINTIKTIHTIQSLEMHRFVYSITGASNRSPKKGSDLTSG